MDKETLCNLCDDVKEIKLAVVGDTTIGVPGLVKRVKSLETWRNQMNLKIAFWSGVGSTVIFVAKWILTGYI